MSPFDPPTRTPLSSAVIRALYDLNPTEQARALAWEVWRLQRQILDMRAQMEEAAGKTHRADVVYGVHRALFLTEKEPCVREAKGFVEKYRPPK